MALAQEPTNFNCGSIATKPSSMKGKLCMYPLLFRHTKRTSLPGVIIHVPGHRKGQDPHQVGEQKNRKLSGYSLQAPNRGNDGRRMIIAQVTAMPVEQAMRSKILVPAGLANTWFYPQERPSAIIPHFWFDTGAGLIDGTSIGYTPESFYSSTSSAGALFSTAADNVQFWHKMITGQVLSASSLAEWRRTIYLNSNTGYGLGIFRYKNFNGHVVYTHGGTAPGAINENLADSVTGVCISLLTNQDSANNNMLFNGVDSGKHSRINQKQVVHL
ncbi:hypothetical protein OSTOST_12629 [Ostertagia ostertagi]